MMPCIAAAIRAALAVALLLIETAITWPVFVIAWLGSAIWLAAKAGRAFAELKDETEKRATLRAMFGERSGK